MNSAEIRISTRNQDSSAMYDAVERTLRGLDATVYMNSVELIINVAGHHIAQTAAALHAAGYIR
jgi:hypothetical protein